jgi:hypothetical protein
MDALAVAPERLKRQSGKLHIVRDDLGFDEGEKILKIIKPVDAAFGEKDMTGFLISHGADEAPISGGNGCIKGCAFRLVRGGAIVGHGAAALCGCVAA